MTYVYRARERAWEPQWLLHLSDDWHEFQQTDARREYLMSDVHRQYLESATYQQSFEYREAHGLIRKYDPSAISFTELPGEIRNKIYDLACRPKVIQPYLTIRELYLPPSTTAYRALLEVSPQISREVKSYVLGRAEVHFKSLACINHFMLDNTYFNAAFKAGVKHISIELDHHDVDELLGGAFLNGSKLLRNRAGVFESDEKHRAQFWRRLAEIDVQLITLYCNVCSFDDEDREHLWKELSMLFGHRSMGSRSKMRQVKMDYEPQWMWQSE